MRNNYFTGVSICVFSYNYENYIFESIQSIIKQEVNFQIEIVVGDDFSTDKTRQILEEIKSKFGDIIVLSFNESNIGGTLNWIRTINKCKGKYIALLDGDDYFTDPLKLQKQFDLLESSPTSVLCFHGVEEIYEDITQNECILHENRIYTLSDFILKGWFIRTSSTFFKNGILPINPPKWVYEFPYRYDTIIHVFLNMKGQTLYINEVMSIWRKHKKGMSNLLKKDVYLNVRKENRLAERLNEYTGKRFTMESRLFISNNLTRIFISLVRHFTFYRYPKLFCKCLIEMNYYYLFSLIIQRFNDIKKIRLG